MRDGGVAACEAAGQSGGAALGAPPETGGAVLEPPPRAAGGAAARRDRSRAMPSRRRPRRPIKRRYGASPCRELALDVWSTRTLEAIRART